MAATMEDNITVTINAGEAYKLARLIETMRLVEAFDVAERVNRAGDEPTADPVVEDVKRLGRLPDLLYTAIRQHAGADE